MPYIPNCNHGYHNADYGHIQLRTITVQLFEAVDLVTTSTTDKQRRWGVEIAWFTVVEMVQHILDLFKY
jgi:hypothetical protein